MRTFALRAAATSLLLVSGAFAASHRNGPLLLEDQTANLNDFYIFRSWETGHTNSVVMSMSVQGFQNPDNGPSYYKFSSSVLYRFNINNSRGLDGNPDMQIDFVFQDLLRPNPTFVSYFGPIMTIDDPSIFLYETYTVVIRNLQTGTIVASYSQDVNGHALSVAPPNLGPVGTPNYETNLGQPSIFTLPNGMRVFAGPRDDAFYFDSGATFDHLDFRAPAPVLAGAADTGQGAAYPNAVDGFAGYNISLIRAHLLDRPQRHYRRLGSDSAPASYRAAQPQRSPLFRRVCAGRPGRQPAHGRVTHSAAHEGLLEPQRPIRRPAVCLVDCRSVLRERHPQRRL